MGMDLARRSVTSLSWNIFTNVAKIVVLFVRSVLLARMLPVETFGVYALATSIVSISAIAPEFGLGGAFLHRARETEDEENAAAVHLALTAFFTLIWSIAMVVGVMVATSGRLQLALLALIVVNGGMLLTLTPRLILTRRVDLRRLAIIDLFIVIFATIAALILAGRGETLNALLVTDLVALVVTAFGLYVWRPVWRPRLAYSGAVIRYYLRFGSRGLAGTSLNALLDHVDDVWTGSYLGTMALGLYSRAFTFATYPRRILAAPVTAVASGAYAELKNERLRLSQAFFRSNGLLVRSGFLMGGLLGLVAPEFIHLFLGDKWLPMLNAFRLMLVFTLLDPIKATVSTLFTAVGRPEQVVQSRLLQLLVMVAGLYLLGQRWNIAGVALTIDLMLLVGVAWLLWKAQQHVDYSPQRLFLAPSIALGAGLLTAWLSANLASDFLFSDSAWLTGAVKTAVFSIIYAGLLFLLERPFLLTLWHQLWYQWTKPALQASQTEAEEAQMAEIP
jgi:O-antigen/teichoic acid export membrane protein